MRARVVIPALAALVLPGCGLEPLSTQLNPVASSASRAYYLSQQGQIVPTACRREPRGGFGGLPPGCARDVAVLAQVAGPKDVLHPRTAGPTPAAPIARAAETYIYGDTGGVAGVPAPPANGAPTTIFPPAGGAAQP